jgi:hypothetical protein
MRMASFAKLSLSYMLKADLPEPEQPPEFGRLQRFASSIKVLPLQSERQLGMLRSYW